MLQTITNIKVSLNTNVQRIAKQIKYKNLVFSRTLNLRRLKRIKKEEVPPYTHCQNCGETLNGMYCHCCGQYAIDTNESFFKFINHYLDTSFAYDGKLWVTIKHLFARPGHLPKEYIQGRIASYMHPFKMYMFCSFIFFFLFFNFTLDDKSVSKAFYSNNNALSIQVNDNKIPNDKNGSFAETNPTESEIKDKVLNKLIPVFKTYAPVGMFVLMPFFAFMLMISFRKKRYPYMSHLIFSINIHTILMLLFSFDILLSLIADKLQLLNTWNTGSIYVYVVILYLLIATKRFYEFKWIKSFILISFNLFIYIFFIVLIFSSFVLINIFLIQDKTYVNANFKLTALYLQNF